MLLVDGTEDRPDLPNYEAALADANQAAERLVQ